MGQDDNGRSLEQALMSTQEDAEKALAATGKLQRAVKTAVKAAETGDLTALRRAFDDADDAVGLVAELTAGLRDGWAFADEAMEEAHLGSGPYKAELLEAARVSGVGLFDQGEDVLACYPSLVRIAPARRQVVIDKKPVRQIRPSFLMRALSKAQAKEPQLRAGQFIELLHQAYRLRGGDGGTQRLGQIHAVLTLLPSAKRDYGRQEFARDIYLLDGSGQTETKSGARMRLHTGSTGARSRPGDLLVVVTREGVEKTYYAVEFNE